RRAPAPPPRPRGRRAPGAPPAPAPPPPGARRVRHRPRRRRGPSRATTLGPGPRALAGRQDRPDRVPARPSRGDARLDRSRLDRAWPPADGRASLLEGPRPGHRHGRHAAGARRPPARGEPAPTDLAVAAEALVGSPRPTSRVPSPASGRTT